MIPCAVNQSRSKACKFPLSPSIFHICGARLPLSISHAMDVSLHENQSQNTSFLSLPLFWCDETGVMKENRTMLDHERKNKRATFCWYVHQTRRPCRRNQMYERKRTGVMKGNKCGYQGWVDEMAWCKKY
jgi:hypothetical protein